MIPGSNLLNQALKLIHPQSVQWLRITGMVTNSLGYKIPSYSAPIEIKGSFQVVPRRMYQIYGLDMTKSFAMFYTAHDVLDIQRGSSGDVIDFDGRRWQALDENDWHPVDGWTGVMLVAIGPIPAPPPEEPDDE